jgi:hypothetical protein
MVFSYRGSISPYSASSARQIILLIYAVVNRSRKNNEVSATGSHHMNGSAFIAGLGTSEQYSQFAQHATDFTFFGYWLVHLLQQ